MDIGIELRKKIIFFVVVGFTVIVFFQLFQMQIVRHEVYDEKSAENSIKGLVQTPLRGVFYDRNYKVIVNNKPAYTVLLTPANYDRKLDRILETMLEVDSGYIQKVLSLNSIYSKYMPIRLQRDVSFNVISWLEENSESLPGITYTVELERDYPDSVMASHMFGYTKEVSKKQLEQDNYYSMGDFIGNNGVEKTYERYLRGIKGVQYVLVDSKRKEIGKYKEGTNDKTSIKGDDLVLGIDASAQRVAEKMFEGKTGALVAIEPKTGEILAFLSAPQYNLNDFTTVTPREVWTNLNTDPLKPLFNRATLSIYPPGSTFKVLGAIAGLESGVINEETLINCSGGFYYGRLFKCHGGAHGSINVVRAIEKSCNTFFFSLIMRVGLDTWSDYAYRFGFGHKTGIDITEEGAGILPSTKWYNKRYGANGWTKGFIVSLGIGQGELSVTPLQMANYTALIANDGKGYQPHLVKGYLDGNKKFVPFEFQKVDTKVSKKTMDLVKKGMFLVVNGEGTGRSIRLPDINIAGKTGTAQNPTGNKKDHAWFIGFAPYEDPKIAVAVLVENAGFGATHAAPIAKAVIQEYLKPKKNEHPSFDNKDEKLAANTIQN